MLNMSTFLLHPNVLGHHNGLAYCTVKVTAVSASGECLPWPRVRHAETRGDMQRAVSRRLETCREEQRSMQSDNRGPARHQPGTGHCRYGPDTDHGEVTSRWPGLTCGDGDMWPGECNLSSVSSIPLSLSSEVRGEAGVWGLVSHRWWYQAWSALAASVANPISAGGKSQAQAARALLSGEIMGLAKIRSDVTLRWETHWCHRRTAQIWV